jgi:outer membrane protein
MKRGPILLGLLGLCATAQAEDLLAVFDSAVQNDPQIREANANRLAAREARPQAWANILPSITASGARSRSWTDGTGFTQQILNQQQFNNVTGGRGSTDTDSWRLDIRQNLFSWAFWSQLKQASHEVALAESDFRVQEQNLAQRVSTQYFDVLTAQDEVVAQEAARDAFARQLDQAEKRFEVGLIAITDVQEQRAARDRAAADVISAKRRLASAQETLRATTGTKYTVLNSPDDTLPLLTPEPATEEEWVTVSMDQNAALISSRLSADIARDQVKISFGGHLPTVDLVAGRTYTDTDGSRVIPPPTNSTNTTVAETYGKSLSLQISVPLFSGGATQSRVRESQYRWIAARERLERTSRDTERQARDAYLGVISEISRVQALKQALESSATALRATEAGYEVGTRTSVDVLDARRLLVANQTAYSQSRYTYLNNLIQLRLASGDLDRGTIEEVNMWLVVPSQAPAPTPTPPSA